MDEEQRKEFAEAASRQMAIHLLKEQRLGCLAVSRSEEHTSGLQSHVNLVCRLLLEKKKCSTTRPTPPALACFRGRLHRSLSRRPPSSCTTGSVARPSTSLDCSCRASGPLISHFFRT